MAESAVSGDPYGGRVSYEAGTRVRQSLLGSGLERVADIEKLKDEIRDPSASGRLCGWPQTKPPAGHRGGGKLSSD